MNVGKRGFKRECVFDTKGLDFEEFKNLVGTT